MDFLILFLMNTFEHVKEKKAIEIRLQRMVHELESITSQNSHMSDLHWRWALDTDLRDLRILADYQNGDNYYYNVITLTNPTIKYKAEYMNTTYWECIKDCDDWTRIVQYFKIDLHANFSKYGSFKHIGPKEVKEMLGLEPVDAIVVKYNNRELYEEEREWLRWIGPGINCMPEGRDDWYIFDKLYLPLIGQMIDAYQKLPRQK